MQGSSGLWSASRILSGTWAWLFLRPTPQSPCAASCTEVMSTKQLARSQVCEAQIPTHNPSHLNHLSAHPFSGTLPPGQEDGMVSFWLTMISFMKKKLICLCFMKSRKSVLLWSNPPESRLGTGGLSEWVGYIRELRFPPTVPNMHAKLVSKLTKQKL